MAQFNTFDRVPNEWRELLIVDAALGAGIMDLLDSDVRHTPAAVAGDLGLDERGVIAVLDALVHLGYVQRAEPGYRLSERARGFLVDAGDARYRRNALRHSAAQLRRLTDLPRVLRTGEPAQAREDHDLERFISAMDDASRPHAFAVVEALLLALPHARKVLDVGGGPGNYARELARLGVATTVLDTPEVVDLIAPRFADEPLVEYLPGDMHQGLPTGPFDLVLLANVLHSYGPEANAALVARAADALAAEGALAIFDFLLGMSPRAEIFSVMMLMSTAAGRCYSESDLAEWCAAAGLVARPAIDFPGRDEQLVIARPGGTDRSSGA